MKATGKKIEKVMAMITEYEQMEVIDREMLDNIWVDRKSGTYNVGKHYEWCKHNDKLEALEKKVRSAVRTLCKELGFKPKKDLKYFHYCKDTAEEIQARYNMAVKAYNEKFYDVYYSAELERL